jgi:catechol 2,3-dioxygenase-like lactoylglutathione lyase family enzyme
MTKESEIDLGLLILAAKPGGELSHGAIFTSKVASPAAADGGTRDRASHGCMADRMPAIMDWRLELVVIPVSDVERAKSFYTERAGFNADHDNRVGDEIRFVQLTPPGSACSIALGTGLSDKEPGSVGGLQLVVSDIEAARAELVERGVEVSEGPEFRLGLVRLLQRPRRQRLVRAGDPRARLAGSDRSLTPVRELGEVRRPAVRCGPGRGRQSVDVSPSLCTIRRVGRRPPETMTCLSPRAD